MAFQIPNFPLQDSDSDSDDIPLIHRSRKRTLVETERAAKGITIAEPQEQIPIPPFKKIHTSGEAPIVEPVADQPQGKEISSTEQVLLTTTPMEISTKTPRDQNPPIVVEVEEEIAATEVNTEVELEPLIEQTMQVESGNREATEIQAQEEVFSKESASSTISGQELSLMKKTNPLAAFKHLLNLYTSSTTMASSPSAASLTPVNQESTEGLLQQLKTKVLEGDLFARIRENPSESFAIKDILQKLHKSDTTTEILTFLVEFGPIFEIFALQVSRRSEIAKLKNQEAILHQEGVNSLKASQTTLEELEAHVAKDEQTLIDWDSKIQRYNEEIKILQTKLANAEHQKSLVQQRMAAPKSKIETEATEALQHLNGVQQHQATIIRLDKELNCLESSIAVNTNILNRLKLTLQNL